jgi:hypothetical protein
MNASHSVVVLKIYSLNQLKLAAGSHLMQGAGKVVMKFLIVRVLNNHGAHRPVFEHPAYFADRVKEAIEIL